MVSRKKILSRSHDGLSSDLKQEEDVWFQKDKLFRDHVQEILNKWRQIDDEIWAKIIVMERNRRVAKAYARAPVLTINGSDDGFDGYRIGLCGFDNPLRDEKTGEIKKHIGNGVKLKMDDGGNIMVKRVGRSNVYVKEIKVDEPRLPNEIVPGVLLELDKPYKVFDMKAFAAEVNKELGKTYPEIRKLETQCISALSFVKDSKELLDCCCWIMVINIVALDMLKTKFPLETKRSSQLVLDEDPYSVPLFENPSLKLESFRDSKPPKLPPRDIGVPVPVPDYDWKYDGAMRKQSGSKDDPYYCGMSARVPKFVKKMTAQQNDYGKVPVSKSNGSSYLGLRRSEEFESRIEDDFFFTEDRAKKHGGRKSAPTYSKRMYVGEWE